MKVRPIAITKTTTQSANGYGMMEMTDERQEQSKNSAWIQPSQE